MRVVRMPLVALILIGPAAAAAPMPFTIQQQASDAAEGIMYLAVSAGDLDGDGLPDDAILKLTCQNGRIGNAFIQPRESASGMASGKRQHKPVTFVKEWGPASPQLRSSTATYDIKKVEGTGAKTMAHDSWTQVDVAGLPPVCATKATKTRSNIQNN